MGENIGRQENFSLYTYNENVHRMNPIQDIMKKFILCDKMLFWPSSFGTVSQTRI
jgi:hypothetical protein